MPERDSYTPGTPCWVDLATTDVEGAKAFYAKLLNWTWTANDMGDGTSYYMFNIRGLNTAGMMAISPEMAGMPPAWSTYLWSDDVDASVAAAIENGASVMVPPTDVHEHGRMAFVIDPTGAAIGLWQPNQHRGAQLYGDPGAMCWHDLQTQDVARASEFYTKTFGCIAQTVPMAGVGDYTLLMYGEEAFAGVMKPEMEGIPRIGRSCSRSRTPTSRPTSSRREAARCLRVLWISSPAGSWSSPTRRALSPV